MDREAERELVRKAARGDRAAAESLIRHFQPGLYSFMLRYTGRVDIAEDVTQDAFVKVLTHLSSFDETWRFSTWLYTIARRVYLNRVAKRRPMNSTDVVAGYTAGADSADDDARDPFGTALFAVDFASERPMIRDALQEALMSLPEVQREIVVMFYQLNWSIRLIAETLSIPEGTVKSHLHRGRRRLRELLERHRELRSVVAEAWA